MTSDAMKRSVPSIRMSGSYHGVPSGRSGSRRSIRASRLRPLRAETAMRPAKGSLDP